MDVKNVIKTYNEVWKNKIDEKQLIEKYHHDELIGDEKHRRLHNLRAGEALNLIEKIESNKELYSDEDELSAWIYWFVTINGVKYHLDMDAARADLGIKELKNR